MKIQTVGFLVLIFTLTSCIYGFSTDGKIIDSETNEPIENARISVMQFDTVYSNINGKFEINEVSHVPYADFEIIIEKNGYLPKHVYFSNHINSNFEIIKLEKTKEKFVPIMSVNSMIFMHNLNKYILSFLNLFTLLFILFNKRINKRFFWFIGIFICNLTFYFSYLDLSLIHFRLINWPFYFREYFHHPFTVEIVIPIALILFWILFIFKRTIIRKNSSTLVKRSELK